MKSLFTLIYVLFAANIFIFPQIGQADSQLSQNDYRYISQTFLKAVQLIDKIEKSQMKEVSYLPLDWIISSAYAGSSQCIIAGYIGYIKNGSCQYPQKVSVGTSQISCNPKIFGNLVVSKPSDGRWTRACGNNFLVKAGIKKKIEDEFTDEEHQKLADYISKNNIQMKEVQENLNQLCEAAKASQRYSDIKDCSSLNELFSKSKSNDSQDEQCEVPGQAVATKDISDIDKEIGKMLWSYNPSKHKVCLTTDTNDHSKYGHASISSLEDYKKYFTKTDGKICYQQAFYELAAKAISFALNGMKAEAGATKNVRVGACDFKITFEGAIKSSPKAYGDKSSFIGYHPVKWDFKEFNGRKSKNTGSLFVTKNHSYFGNNFSELTKDSKALFESDYENFESVFKNYDDDVLSAKLIREITTDAYIYCSNNQK